MRRASSPRGRLWYVFYGVCLTFVASFVLFEALDIDGSDFHLLTMPARSALSQSSVEEHEDDFRRVSVPAALLTAIILLEAAIVMMGAERVNAVHHVVGVMSHHYRIALPRASLGEAAPPA